MKFFVRAIVAGVLSAHAFFLPATAQAQSAQVTLAGLAFSGDALAHSTLAGVAVAFVSGGSVVVGALVAAVVTALGVGLTRRRARVSYDTAIGIFFVSMFSFGMLILSRRTSYTPAPVRFPKSLRPQPRPMRSLRRIGWASSSPST